MATANTSSVNPFAKKENQTTNVKKDLFSVLGEKQEKQEPSLK